MNLPEAYTTLSDAGYKVSVNHAHTSIFVELQNRTVNTMEVEFALDFTIDRSRISRTDNGVMITE